MLDFDDITQKCVVRKALEGIKRSKGSNKDQRLPITFDLLHKIIGILSKVCFNNYEALLFKAAFALAFHALLRISELAVSNGQFRHILSLDDISCLDGVLKIKICTSKTDQAGKGTLLTISKQTDQVICPVVLVNSYLKSRPNFQGPLFCHFNGKPLTRFQVVSVLKRSISFLGINDKGYSSHSFRIGAATSMSQQGISDNLIMQAGRWKSNVYKEYIRT